MELATTTKADDTQVTLTGAKIIAAIKQSGVEFILAVPDIVTSKGLLFPIAADKDLKLVRVCKEDECVGIASGLTYCDKRALILIQYTGFLDSLNAIRAVAVEYKQPIVMMVGLLGHEPERLPAESGRYGVRIIEPICDAMGIPHHLISQDADIAKIKPAIDKAYTESSPVAIPGRTEAVMMNRDECFEILKRHITDEVVVASYSSAVEWNDLNPRALNYFSVGAMGLGSSHALGLALGRPDRRVVVLDGDGSLLMNLGSLVSIAAAAPKNLVHFVCHNEMLRGERRASAAESEDGFRRPRALGGLCAGARFRGAEVVRAAGRARADAGRAGVRDPARQEEPAARLRIRGALQGLAARGAQGGAAGIGLDASSRRER